MKQMTRRAYLLLAFLLAFTAGLVILLVIYVADAKAWTSYPANRHIYNSEAVLSGGGTITDRSGVILAQTVDGKRVYNSKAEIRKAVLHMVGDSDGFIKTGLQSSYWEQLVGYNLVNGVFQPSGRGTISPPPWMRTCQPPPSRRWAAIRERWAFTTTKLAKCSAWSVRPPST